MTATAKALKAFFSGFGVPAWPEYAVPETAREPYITYTVEEPEWDAAAMLQARIWTRSASYEPLNRMTDDVLKAVGSGVLLPAGSGSVCIRPASPLAQVMPFPGEPEMKVMYLNFQLNAYHMQGE